MKKFSSFLGLLALLLALIFIFIAILSSSANGEEEIACWVLCQPGDYINVREKPSRKSDVVGRFDPCDELATDGVVKNGYLHLIGLNLEGTDCWIHAGYISYDKPKLLSGKIAKVISKARLAARKHIGGKVRKWLKNGNEVRVYFLTDDWCVTNQGFVKTQYLALEEY